MRTLVGSLMLALAVLLGLMELATLPGPAAATSLASNGVPLAPAAPWYEHLGWTALALALAWGGVRLLNGGILGRLVRGRGFTPAEQ